jgi:hypothetical protein
VQVWPGVARAYPEMLDALSSLGMGCECSDFFVSDCRRPRSASLHRDYN